MRIAHLACIVAVAGLVLGAAADARAQLNEHCTVTVLNRTVQVSADGSWQLPTVPANFGRVKARATCVDEDGITRFGESEFFEIPNGGVVTLPYIVLGATHPIPSSISVSATGTLTASGQTLQLAVTATYPDGSTANVAAASSGTNYTISNRAVTAITADGLLTALASGAVLIQATNDGTPGMTTIAVTLSNVDTDGDGIPDDVELRYGLDPNNPADALEDPDHDGLTNAQEIALGTDPRNADTDGDGISDGQEAATQTSPLLRDTDGDGISDGLEVQLGTDPLDADSFNLAAALNAISVTPTDFTVTVNQIGVDGSIGLRVTGHLKDGSSIDLTSSDKGTTYQSSSLAICNFGGSDGEIFGGSAGQCTITVSSAGFTATAVGLVRTFTPVPLSNVTIPGYANRVDVNGDFAYVAAGSGGLQIVDVSNRLAPAVVGSIALPGNANDVKIAGTRAYVAAGAAGLQIVDVTDPHAPQILGAAPTPGADARDVHVSGGIAYVADGAGGLQIIDATTPGATILLGSLAFDAPATGVAVSGTIALVATGWAGLQVVDVSQPGTPVIVGNAYTQDAQDVTVDGTLAYVADLWGGIWTYDISVPDQPSYVSSLPYYLSGVTTGVAASGGFLTSADSLSTRLPIVDARVPGSLQLRASIDFTTSRYDYTTGVAMDATYLYATAVAPQDYVPEGVTGDSRLYIGQFGAPVDLAGIPPTVTITSPAAGAVVVEGETIPITVTAVDDVGVSVVNFLVDGVVVFRDTTAPYEFSIVAPIGVTTMTIGASAGDVGSNTGVAADAPITVIPDPLTTFVGRVVDSAQQPMAGLTVDVLGRTTVSAADGTFSIGGVPTARHLLVVHATLQSTTSFLTGSSAPTPPVRGGTTSVGDIVVRSAAFETDLGTLAPDCFNCQLTVTLPFTFPMSGAAIHQVSVDLNGYLVSDGGYINAFCCNLKRDPDDPASGLYVNDQLTDRLVVTWYRERTDYTGDGLNTIQVVLFADGRIQFGYDGIAAGGYPEVDVQTAANLIFREVDFSASSDLIQGPNDGLYESFDPVNRPFDLDGGFVVFEPRLEGGYRIRSVSDAVGPTCSMTSPANGSTVFGGEHIIVETTATHQFPITRVSFRSSDDSLDADALPWTPFSASFIVPLGVSQLTLTATVYDSWNHPAVCTTTVNVVAGPPPAVTILSPAAGTVLTAGSAIAVKVQAISRLPVSRIDGAVNGRAFFSHPIEFSEAVEPPNPQVTEFRFTVPAGAASVTLSGSAVDSVGKTGDSGGVTFSVAADARTALRGRVVDQSDAAVSGARVRAMLHGVSAEIFDFSTALTELPDLTGRTPDRITTVPSLNMRNPDLMFGSDPFGFGASPSRVVRFTSALSLDGGCYCVFTLGVNQGARLIVNGYTILDVAGLSGFQQVRSQPISLRGAGSLQLLTYDNGGLDVQLSFEHTGWGTPAEVVPPGAFVPAIDLWQTTSDSSGAFAIANMPTTLGDLGAIATVVPATGTRSSGRAAAVPPVANGPTDVGTIRLGASPDIFTGDGDFGSVFRIDAITGTVEQVTVGPSLRNPTGLTMLRSGLLAVASSTPLTGGVAIVSVDPRLPSGQNTSVIASGGLLQAPAQIVEEAGGTLVVSDSFGPLIRIDPALPPSGNQSLVSTDLFSSSGLALEADGTIIIGDRYSGVLVRVNPQTGAQTPVPGSSGYPIYVAVESSGSLLLTSNPFFGPVTVYRLAADGTTTSLASGNYVYNPTGMALEPSGDILLMDSFYGLVRVNKDTGAQTLLVPRDVLGSPVGVTLAPR